MNDRLVIEQGTTNIQMYYSKLDVTNKFIVKRVLDDFCHKKLTTYDYNPRLKRHVLSKLFFIHDEKEGKYIIPTSFFDTLVEFLIINGTDHEIKKIELYTPTTLQFKLNKGWVPREHQIKPVEYLSGKHERCGLEMQTGKGKTFSTTCALSNIGLTSMIIVRGLVGQWLAALEEQTNLGDKIYVIQGFKSLEKLFKSDLRPSVFICSLDTMRAYVKHQKKYQSLPPYSEFVKTYGVGVKVVDEAHMCFHAISQLDMSTNVPHNIYLTATFDTANSMVKRIFRTYFPNQLRYGGAEYDKYTSAFYYAYSGTVDERQCITPKGYSHAKYEEFLLKRKTLLVDYFERLVVPIINMHYINKKYIDKKMVIFCARVDMVKAMVEHLRMVYPKLTTMSYVAADPDSVLEEADIIVSTHKSCGTGTDIAKLQVVVNLVSFMASTLAKQVFGRLRKPKDGSTPEYVDILDLRIKSHVRHWRERSAIVKGISLKYHEFRL